MPRLRRWLLVCFVILHSSFCFRVTGQTYSVDWFTVAGGGGTSTGSVYTVSGTFGQPDAGKPMTGGGYSVTSGFWSLFAPVGPVLVTTPPTNTPAVAGSSPVLSATLSGTPPFSYQWYFNGMALSNATNASLTLTNFAATNAGSYTLAVSNAAGGVVSAPFVVSLLTFSVDWFAVAGGGGTSTGGGYTVSGTFGQPDAGAEMQGGGYAVDGGFWSLFAVEVPVLPAFVVSPTNMNVEAGSGTVLSVTASGTQPLTYQWYFDGAALSNATNATLALTNFLAGSVGTYQVAVSNAAGGILSTPFTINFPVYSVDWFKVAGGGGISTGSVYTVNGTFGQQDAGGPMQGGGYSVEVGYWSLYAVQTSSVTGNAPVITSEPQSVIIPPGNSASFTVSVTGTPSLLYQWQKNGANLTDGGNISGSTNATLTLSTTSFNDGGSYSVTVENAYSSVNSSVAKLTLLLPAYSITDLGTLGGTISYALGINNSGQVAGYSCMAGNAVYQAFLYSGGTMTNLGTLGGNYSWANAINNNGQVVGWSYTGVIYPAPYYYYNNGYEYVAYQNIPQTHAFLYSGGTMTDLGVFGVRTRYGSSVYGQSSAAGINDSGQVVGNADTSSGSSDSFLYSDGELNDLSSIIGNPSFNAYGINNGGVVVGAANVGNVNGPVSLKNGIISYLGTLGGYGGFAQCINNKGQVTGYSYTAGNVANHGFLYSGGPLVDLGTLGGSWCYPQGINNSGQVVGYSVTASNFEHAFLYSGGAMFDLNNLANTNSIGAGFYFQTAFGINDSGQIIANGSNGRAYLLTPIAPATYLAGNLRPELQPPAATGGNIQFNWNLLNTSPAVGYQVQYTTNLVSGPWVNLGGVQTTTSFTTGTGTDAQRFYRVLLVQ